MNIPVASATDFPTAPFYIFIDSEYMYVTKIEAGLAGSEFIVERGQLNTTAAAHAAGATVTSVISTTTGGQVLGGI
jgi:hypothetical protein